MFTRNALWTAVAAAAAVLMSAGASATETKGAVYADVRYGLDHFEAKNSDTVGAGIGYDDTTFENHGSYWGIKGSTSKDGLMAFGAYEEWLNADSSYLSIGSPRQAYGGLSTPYGTVQYGTFATAYMDSGRKLDPFYATGAAGIGQRTFLNGTLGYINGPAGGVSHGQSFLANDTVNNNITGLLAGVTGGFVPNQLAYTSPTLFGVTLNTAIMFDAPSQSLPAAPQESRRDDYALGAEWNGMGLTAGVQYLDANSHPQGVIAGATNTGLLNRESATRLYGGFSQERFGANVSAERINHTAGVQDSDFLQVNGWFGVMPNCRIAASYGMENESGAEGSSFRVGVFHDVLENFTVHVVYRNYNAKPEGGATTPNFPDDQVISLGASYRFELGAATTTR